ncbi:rhamnan synthesis protein F [Fusibacter paucivorans]|uniref:Rhamnan synthesis protein F n=1 Tax=Fusibacter paucivorans TaxID=76009 RepID=A0ABS5PNG2_9FIRM|nr:rhamnan synthesis F family protein [Fusibacter paucivorans]MBS7526608.1 rhamnan synthesis protein F [Fusibacter paucivorans]
MKLNDQAKRACIYFIYDKDGIIDDYIIYQLNDMRENVEFLHCVINGKLTAEGKRKLEKIADEVYVRDNIGNDIGAYKGAIERIGWKKLKKYDELVLMNNTCFGPLFPFKEVFDWSKDKELDFWGLTLGLKADWLGSNNYIHYNENKTHYQSYFLTIRKPLLASKLLVEFFDEIPEDANYVISGSLYEYAFPGYFEDHGFKGAVYCDNREDTNYPLLHNPIQLINTCRMPLFKKRSFFHHYTDVLNNTAGEATARLIRFIEEETDYNMDLVWKTLLRTSSLSDLVRCAQLNRILPRDMLVSTENDLKLKVGLIYHAYYEDLFDEDILYMKNFPVNSGLLITTNTYDKKVVLEKKIKLAELNGKVIVIENRGRDVSSLLVGGADFVFNYDLICFAHDKKTSQVKPHSVGRSWAYKINENIFATKEFVSNVITMFEKESQLGIAFPSYPNHSGYAYNIESGWTGNYWNTKKLLNSLSVDVKINEHTLCVAPLGTCFWFRPKALKKLFDGYDGNGWSYSDFPREPNRTDQTLLHAIERAYAYFAQDAGYYPVFLYNDKYTEIELTNLEFNKIGSTEMRAWVDALALDAIGYRKIEDTFNKPAEEVSSMEMLQYYNPQINYGVKKSLVHLAFALRHKFPRMWKVLFPLRRISQKLLGIKTK